MPLVNFDIIEWHLTDRVSRQFGFHQPIPMPCNTNLSLHRIDRRGRDGQDWREFHGIHIMQWVLRYERILHGPPSQGHLAFDSQYMTWYRMITRSLVGNPSHRHVHGYRPTASTVEFWVCYHLISIVCIKYLLT